MNLATSSLIIFLLLSPAILARRVYFTRELSKDFITRNTLQEIFSSIFVAIVLHAIWCSLSLLVSIFTPTDGVDFEFILKILIDSKSITDYSSFTNNVGWISLYFSTLYIFSGVSGYFGKKIVRDKGWDRKSDLLEFDNKWAYLISGEVLDMKRYKKLNSDQRGSKEVGFLRYADILIKSDENIIYSGVVADFQLSSNSLDFLVLHAASKLLITKIKDNLGNVTGVKEQQVPMPTSYLVLPYSDILNINLRFGYLTVTPNENTDTADNANTAADNVNKVDTSDTTSQPEDDKKAEEEKKIDKEISNIIINVENINISSTNLSISNDKLPDSNV